MGSAFLSDILGWTSILCWLGAQFPQVIENVRRQSCDGLALPFLANWLLGDITNLIGCILTRQLPFQTWLAAYFVSVDFTLFAQYFYYYNKSSAHASAYHARARQVNGKDAAEISPLLGSTTDSDRTRVPFPRHSFDRAESHYRALSDAAANVALIAARAASAEASSSYRQRQSVDDLSRGLEDSHEEEDLDVPSAMMDSFYSEGGYGRHTNSSVYSRSNPAYVSYTGQTTLDRLGLRRGKTVSWSRDTSSNNRGRGRGSSSRSRRRDTTLSPLTNVFDQRQPPTSTSSDLHIDTGSNASTLRGRPLQRQVVISDSPIDDHNANTIEDVETGAQANIAFPAQHSDHDQYQGEFSPRESIRQLSSSAAPNQRPRKISRANSVRGAGLVFLSVWMFWGVGGQIGQSATINSSLSPFAGSRGAVLSRYPLASINSNQLPRRSTSEETSFSPFDTLREIIDTIQLDALTDDTTHSSKGNPEADTVDMERIIGRISAWICTTLYLTSRLPQIWKNYTRKSVDGLSIALFVCAFLGNTFYVLSILTSPNLDRGRREAVAFLRESVPYLLGSGGTLLFDVTIVVQSFLYKDRLPITSRPRYHTRANHTHHRLSPSIPYPSHHSQHPSSPHVPPISPHRYRTSDPLAHSISSLNSAASASVSVDRQTHKAHMVRSRSRTLSSTLSPDPQRLEAVPPAALVDDANAEHRETLDTEITPSRSRPNESGSPFRVASSPTRSRSRWRRQADPGTDAPPLVHV